MRAKRTGSFFEGGELRAPEGPPTGREREILEEYRGKIPDDVLEKHHYQPLDRRTKERIFGLNAAKVFNIDVEAKRNTLPGDALGRLRMSYLEEGPEPSRRVYGWVAG